MKIDKKRFELREIGSGKKAHIFPKNLQSVALCLMGPARGEVLKNVADEDICKDCAREYNVVSRSPALAIFMR